MREYLDAGIPVFAGHKDSGIPEEFPFFHSGNVNLEKIISFSKLMRNISRNEVKSAASNFISKEMLLYELNKNLSCELMPLLIGGTSNFDHKDTSNSLINKNVGLIALTGASGFVGKALLLELISEGFKVRVLTRSPNFFEEFESVEVFEGDLLNTQDWTDFLDGADVVIHAAAEIKNPLHMEEINFHASNRLLDAALKVGVRRWIQLSSVGAYGPDVSGWVNENSLEKPNNLYETTKTLFDSKLRDIAKLSKLEVCILRPSNIYGSKMTNMSLFQMINTINRRIFSFIGLMGASANYVHIKDVVSAVLLCVVHKNAVNKTYIVSDWTTIENMVRSMSKHLSVSMPRRRIPKWFAMFLSYIFRFIPLWPLTSGRVKALTTRARYSTDLIAKELGWRVLTPIFHGMQDLVGFGKLKKLINADKGRPVKKVLIVTYDWPPRNSIATHRPYSWARYWSEQGIEVTVLTAVKKFFDAPLDLELPKLKNVKVVEVDYSAFVPISKFLNSGSMVVTINFFKKIKNLILYISGWEYDLRSKWAAESKFMIEKLGTDFDVIVSTYGPDSSHKIASQFKKRNPSLFWVADYRDLWSLNVRNKSSKFIKMFIRRSEVNTVKAVDLFTTVSRELSESLFNLISKRPEVIYNGYDVEVDFSSFVATSKSKKIRLDIVYTGRIYPGKRSPLTLMKAIEELIDMGFIGITDVKINFYGPNTETLDKELLGQKYANIISHHGYIPRKLALEVQKNTDLLLLMESGDAEAKGFLTGKIFEYLAAGRPIISIGSSIDSAISRVLSESGCGRCYEDNSESLARDLRDYLRSGEFIWFKPDLKNIQRYSREHQAERLLEKIVEHRAIIE